MVRKLSCAFALVLALAVTLVATALPVRAQEPTSPLQSTYDLRARLGARLYEPPAGVDTFSQSLAGTLQPQAEGIAYAIYTTAFDASETEYTATAGSNAAHAMIFLVSNRVLVPGAQFYSSGRTWTVEQVYSGNDVLNTPIGLTDKPGVKNHPKWTSDLLVQENDNGGYYRGAATTVWEVNVTTVIFDQTFSTVRPSSNTAWFAHFEHLDRVVNPQYLDTSASQSFSGMFAYCQMLRNLDMSSWRTGEVRSLRSAFRFCTSLKRANLAGFDISKCTSFMALFDQAHSLEIATIENWNIAAATQLGSFFFQTNSLKAVNMYGVSYPNNSSHSACIFFSYSQVNRILVSPGFSWTSLGRTATAGGSAPPFSHYAGSGITYTYPKADGTWASGTEKPNASSDWKKANYSRLCAAAESQSQKGLCTALYSDPATSNGTYVNAIDVRYHDNINYAELAPSDGETSYDTTDPTVSKLPVTLVSQGMFWDAPVPVARKDNAKFIGWSTTPSGEGNDEHGNPARFYPLGGELKDATDAGGYADIAGAGETVHLYAQWSQDLSLANVTLLNSVSQPVTDASHIGFTYDGVAKVPNVTVTYGSKILVPDVDYTVSFSNNINGYDPSGLAPYGIATATITAIDGSGYEGSQTVEFYIAPGHVTVTAASATGVAGGTQPAFDCSVEGLAAGDTLGSVSYTVREGSDPASAVVADPMASAGARWVHPSSLEASDDLVNYQVDWVAAPLSVVDPSAHHDTFYAVPSADGTTLTLTAAQPASGTYYTADAATAYTADTLPWAAAAGTATRVELDPSMASVAPTTCANWLSGFSRVTEVRHLEYLSLARCTSVAGLFGGCSSLASVDLSGWDTSSVTDMGGLFRGCSSLTGVTCPASLVGPATTSVAGMFQGCASLAELPLAGWDTSAVTDFGGMLSGCSGLGRADLTPLSFASATSTAGMLDGCTGITYLSLPPTWPAAGATSPVALQRVALAEGDEAGTPLAAGAQVPAYIASAAGANAWSATGDVTGRRCLVEFDGQGGTDASVLLSDGDNDVLTFPGTSRPGYAMLGWSATQTVIFDDEGMPTNGQLYQPGTSITFGELALWEAGHVPQSITLYAQWSPLVCSVYYMPNRSTYAGSVATQVWDVAAGGTLSAADYGFTATGYHVASWNTGTYGTGASYVAGQDLGALRGDRQLYAQWEPNVYQVAYDANTPGPASGSVTDMPADATTHHFDASEPISAQAPSLAGWTFQGWSLDGTTYAHTSEEAGVYAAGASVSNLTPDPALDGSTVVTLHAQWAPRTYQVAYDANKPADASADVTGMPASPSTFTFDKSNAAAAAPQLAGWTFQGWNTSSDGAGASYAGGAAVADNLVADPEQDGSSEVTLHAVWARATVDVVYDADGGTVAGQAKVTSAQPFDAVMTPPAAPSRPGYTFAGWCTAATHATYASEAFVYGPLGSVVAPADAVTSSTKASVELLDPAATPAATVYAAWVADEYEVSFGVAETGGEVTEARAFPDGVPATQRVRHGKSPSAVDAAPSVTVPVAVFTHVGWQYSYTDAGGTDRSGSVSSTAGFVAYGNATLLASYTCKNSILVEAENGYVSAAVGGAAPAAPSSLDPRKTVTFVNAGSAAALASSAAAIEPTSENYRLAAIQVTALGAEGSFSLSGDALAAPSTSTATLDGVEWQVAYTPAGSGAPATVGLTTPAPESPEAKLTGISVRATYERIVTSYRVEHWKQRTSLDGYDEVVADAVTHEDVEAGSPASYSANSYVGFVAPTVTYYAGSGEAQAPTASTTVRFDGTTVVRLLYDRTATEVAFDTHGGSLLSSITARYGVDLAPVTPPTLAGFVLRGIYAGANAQGTRYYDGAGEGVAAWDSTAPSATLHAAWLWDLSFAQVADVADQSHTGAAVTPTPAVTWSDGTTSSRLRTGTHFDYAYSNNTDVTWRRNASGVFAYAKDAIVSVGAVEGTSTYSGAGGVDLLSASFDIKSADTEAARATQEAIAAVTGAGATTPGPLATEPASASDVTALLNRRAGIEAAWSAYDGLTPAQRALVTPGWATDATNLKAWLDDYGELANGSVSVGGFTYDGAAHECVSALTDRLGTSLLGTDEATVTYQRWSTNSSTWVNVGTPRAAGTYRAVVTPGATGRYAGTLVSDEFVVARAALTVTGQDVPSAAGTVTGAVTYTGQEQTFASTSNEGSQKQATLIDATGLVAGHYVHAVTYRLSGTDAGDYASTPYSGAAAGERLLSVYDADGADVTGNYQTSYAPGTLTISPASLAPAAVSVAPLSLVRNAPTIAPQPTSVTLAGVTGKGTGGALAAGTEYAVAYRRAGTTATVDAIDAAGSWEIVVSPASGNFCDQAVLAVTVTDATYGVGYAANRPGAATHDVTGMPAAPSTWTYGTANANALAAAPALVGWDFGGWSVAASGAGATYAAGSSTTDDLVATPRADGTSSTMLHARWSPRTYQVAYDANTPASATHEVAGMPAAPSIFTYDAANAVDAATPTLEGWDFEGWALAGATYQPGGAVSAGTNLVADPVAGGTSSATLVAQWRPRTTAVALDAPDATTAGTASVTATYDASMPAASMPERVGYEFAGFWLGEGETATKYYNADGTSARAWDVDQPTATLAARWTAGEYLVTLDAPNATSSYTTSVSATFDEAMPTDGVDMPTRVGYDFMGYYDAAGTMYYAADGSSARTWDVASNDVTLTAHWRAHTTSLTFQANGGTGAPAGLTATYDQAMPALSGLPTRAGHTFAGFADEPGGGTLYYDASGGSCRPWDKDVASATLYAQWEVRSYPVTFASELEQVSGGSFDKSLLTYADPSVTSEQVAYGGTPAAIVTAPLDVTQTLDGGIIQHRLIGWTWSYTGADGLVHAGTQPVAGTVAADFSYTTIPVWGLTDADVAAGSSVRLVADYTVMPFASATATNGRVGVSYDEEPAAGSSSGSVETAVPGTIQGVVIRFEPTDLNWELPADGITVRDQYGNVAMVAREEGEQTINLGGRTVSATIAFDEGTTSSGHLTVTSNAASATEGVPLSVNFAYTFSRIQATYASEVWLQGADGSYARSGEPVVHAAVDSGSDVAVEPPAAPAGWAYSFATYASGGREPSEAPLPVAPDSSTTIRYHYDLVTYTATLTSPVACSIDAAGWEAAGASYAWTRSFTVLDAFDLPAPVPDDYAKGFLGWRAEGAAVRSTAVAAGTTGDVTLAAEWRDLVVVPRPALSGTLTYTGAEQAAPVVVPEGYELDGSALVPVGGGEAVASASGDVAGTDAGTYTATFDLADGSVWEGGSLGRLSLDWAIAPADARGADVSVADCVWDGTPQRPSPRVTLGGVELVEGRDYEVAYANNVAPGTATVTVTFRGNYAGTASATFRIREPRADARVMHRLYNPNSGEHFYTASASERDAVAAAGWRYEGVGWYAPGRGGEPVYRLYNAYAGDHHYTLDAGERDALVDVGWTYEGVGWTSDAARRVPVWRQYNPNALAGAHNFTTDEREHVALCGLGWRGEGVAWYGL